MSSSSMGSFYVNILMWAAEKNMPIMRGVARNPQTGEKFEVIAIDRGNGEVVPLFLVPKDGAATITKYEVLAESPDDEFPGPSDFDAPKQMH